MAGQHGHSGDSSLQRGASQTFSSYLFGHGDPTSQSQIFSQPMPVWPQAQVDPSFRGSHASVQFPYSALIPLQPSYSYPISSQPSSSLPVVGSSMSSGFKRAAGHVIDLDSGEEVLIQQVTGATKKRRGKGKKPTEPDQQADQARRSSGGRGAQWTEHHTINLIHLRGLMEEEFNKAPKQGIDVWLKLYTKLMAICPDFDKDLEACRQKHKTLMKDYRKDKAENETSGHGRSDKCRFFDFMDEYHGSRPVVNCHAHASSLPRSSAPLGGGSVDSTIGSTFDDVHGDPQSEPMTPIESEPMQGEEDEQAPTSSAHKEKKARKGDAGLATMEQMVRHTESSLQEYKAVEAQKLTLIQSMNDALGNLATYLMHKQNT